MTKNEKSIEKAGSWSVASGNDFWGVRFVFKEAHFLSI